ncbi:MAG: hypothetical protein OSB15_11200 [Amylibacter sp.]|nr:hypothetical protein [Amylibacter sp.]
MGLDGVSFTNESSTDLNLRGITASTIEEIEQSISEAITSGFRNRLLERG